MAKMKILAITLMAVMILSATTVFAGEWVIFSEELLPGASLEDLHADSRFIVSSDNPYAGTNHLKRDLAAAGGWAWITGISGLNLDLTGIVYEDAYIQFYMDSGSVAIGYIELKIGGPGWTPTNQFNIATDGTPGYEEIKVMLTDFTPDLDTFTGGTSSIDRWSVGFGAESDVLVDEVIISDGIGGAAVSAKHKLASTWGRLKSR